MRNENYGQMIKYVEKVIQNAPNISKIEAKYPFRTRFRHIVRVVKWCERILEFEKVEDEDIVYIAAIFHDSGKPFEGERLHPQISSEICRRYLKTQGYDGKKIDRICYCIENHSKKLSQEELEFEPRELVVLLEADVLDEIGAIGVLWDSMATAMEFDPTYEKAFSRIEGHFKNMKSKGNRAYTVTGKKLYEERMVFIEKYIEELKFELEVTSFMEA